MQRIEAKADRLHRARAETLDNDIGGSDQLGELRAIAGRVHVKNDASLVRIQEQEQTAALAPRLIAGERRVVAGRITARRLDFDYVRAVVSKDPRAERSGAVPGKVDHAYVVQRH